MKHWIFFLLLFFPLICFSQQQEKINVHFAFDSYDLDTASESVLRNAVHDKIISKISIEAHCDSIGTNNYNDALSMRRAEEVKKYLVSINVDEALISISGFGKKVPLNGNENVQQRALNRRAEILITYELHPPVDSSRLLLKNPDEVDSTKSPAVLLEDIQNAEVGSTIKLENINFYGGRHVWLPRSEKTLKQLLKTMQDNPTLEIEIQGHICCIAHGDGPDFDVPGMPKKLSVNRAKAIYLYLINNGIDKSRLSYTGFGADRKLIKYERTEADRESNRRVEIKIVKK